jgi:hypothetical protein
MRSDEADERWGAVGHGSSSFEEIDESELDGIAGGQLYFQGQATNPVSGLGMQYNTSSGFAPVQTASPFFDFNPTDPSNYTFTAQAPVSPITPFASVNNSGDISLGVKAQGFGMSGEVGYQFKDPFGHLANPGTGPGVAQDTPVAPYAESGIATGNTPALPPPQPADTWAGSISTPTGGASFNERFDAMPVQGAFSDIKAGQMRDAYIGGNVDREQAETGYNMSQMQSQSQTYNYDDGSSLTNNGDGSYASTPATDGGYSDYSGGDY